MRCAKCGSDSPAGKTFCSDCGAPLTNRCPKCEAENPLGKRFCGDCGTALAATSATAQSPTSLGSADIAISAEPTNSVLAEGERKTVTALFADIKGSMELIRSWSGSHRLSQIFGRHLAVHKAVTEAPLVRVCSCARACLQPNLDPHCG